MSPQREERQKCWNTRDAYFACLDVLGIVVPGEEASNKKCKVEKKAYERACAKSWVRHSAWTVEYSSFMKYGVMKHVV